MLPQMHIMEIDATNSIKKVINHIANKYLKKKTWGA